MNAVGAASAKGAFRVARRIAQAAGIAVLVVGGTMLVLAVAGPAIGLGRDEHFLLFGWFGLTRFDAAADAGLVLAMGGFLTALTFTRRPGVLLCNTVVPIILAELIARGIDGRPIFALHNWLAERNGMFAAKTENDYDPVLGWVPKANMRLNSSNPGSSITTGPFGTRLHRNDAGEPGPGAILAIGDSFTFGTDVGDHDTWPANLEQLLDRPVINAGVPGYGVDQIVLRGERLVPLLKPSILVVDFFEADFARAGFKVLIGANKPYFTTQNGLLVLHNVPVPPYSGRLRETPLWLVPLSYSYFVQFAADRLGWADWGQYMMRSAVAAGNDPEAVSCALLRRLKDALAANGTKLLLVLEYAGSRNAPKPPKAVTVAACARELGLNVLDFWDELALLRTRSFGQYGKLWLPGDGKTFGHMSAEGNLFVAQRIAAKFREGVLGP